jgi:hypothetical protein
MNEVVNLEISEPQGGELRHHVQESSLSSWVFFLWRRKDMFLLLDAVTDEQRIELALSSLRRRRCRKAARPSHKYDLNSCESNNLLAIDV